MSAFAIGTKGYVGHGNTPTAGSQNDLWEYDPVADTWTQKASMPGITRRRGVGFSVNGYGYMGLGVDGVTGVVVDDMWEYDPFANTWVQMANFPAGGRFGAVGFAIGNKGYAGTGFDIATGQIFGDIWEFDPANNTWTQKANFGGGIRNGAACFVVGNKAYVGQGGDTLQLHRDLWEYDPVTNSWTAMSNCPSVSRSYGVGFTIFNRGYIGTGIDSASNYLDDWYEFNPATNTWAVQTNFPGGGRFHMIGFGINCRGYVGTGHWGLSPMVWFDDWFEFVPTDFYFAGINVPGGTAICPGSSATLIGTGGVSYSWSTGATSTSIVVTPTGNTTYSVTATTAGPLGCTSTAVVTLTVKAINLTTSTIAINCATMNGSATVNTNNSGTPPYTYLWSPGNQTTVTATGLTAAGNYTVNVTDAAGCTATTTVSIVAFNAPFAVVSGNTNLCAGDATTLLASGGNTYSWSTGSTSTILVLTPTATTTYTLQASVGNCHDTASVTVNVFIPPVAALSPDLTICEGYPATITATGGSGAPYSYVWNTGPTTTSMVVSPTATTTYSVMISIGTCKDSGDVTLTTVPSPTATVTGNTTLCTGDITTLSATGGGTYSWSNNATSPSIVVSPPVTTTYTVYGGNGYCLHDTSITVNVFAPPVAGINGTPDICQGSMALFTATGGGTYLWSTGSTSASITPSAAGNYSVVVTIGTCSDSANVNLTVHPLPVVDASPDITIVQGQSTNITAWGASNYIWNGVVPGQSQDVSPQYTEVFCVTGTDANGCADTACVTVYVISCETAGELYLPNAFSPNGDGENDELQVYFGLFDCIKSLRLSVYNRWGERIYFTVDPFFKWNGLYSKGILEGTHQDPGTQVYTYVLEVELGDFSKISRKGNLSLIR